MSGQEIENQILNILRTGPKQIYSLLANVEDQKYYIAERMAWCETLDDPNEKCRIEDDILESRQELRETEFIIRNLIGTFLIIVEDAKILGLIQ